MSLLYPDDCAQSSVASDFYTAQEIVLRLFAISFSDPNNLSVQYQPSEA
jgi:hypothetical protein